MEKKCGNCKHYKEMISDCQGATYYADGSEVKVGDRIFIKIRAYMRNQLILEWDEKKFCYYIVPKYSRDNNECYGTVSIIRGSLCIGDLNNTLLCNLKNIEWDGNRMTNVVNAGEK